MDFPMSFTKNVPGESSEVIAYLSLGSNLGDRTAHIEQAIRALPAAGVRVLRRSSLYETEPVDVSPASLAATERTAQPWFLNAVVEAETSLTPHSLLDALLAVERSLGRVRSLPGAARTIDLDILFYSDLVLCQPGTRDPAPAPSRAPLRADAAGGNRTGTSPSGARPQRRGTPRRDAGPQPGSACAMNLEPVQFDLRGLQGFE